MYKQENGEFAMKLLLIYPPITRPTDFDHRKMRVSPFFPLGLAYLAAAVSKTEHHVLVRDYLINMKEEGVPYSNDMIRYGETDEYIYEDIKKTKADIVGISCLFAAMEFDTKNLCRIAKAALPGAYIILGGPHAGASADKFLDESPEISAVILGEGEKNLIQLMDFIKANKDISKVDGIAYRDSDNHVITKQKQHYIQNLDSIHFPSREMFDMPLYFNKSKSHNPPKRSPCAQLITSRGCPFKCTFCALGRHWGEKQRLRSATNVLEEIELLVNKYGVKEIHFEDDNLTFDKKRAIEIFKGIIDAKWDITWAAPTGLAVATLDEELLTYMKDSGCYSISLAIESGDQNVLTKLMHKPVNLKKLPGIVQIARNLDLKVKGFFILGYPGETKLTMYKTIKFAQTLELDWSYFFIATPMPHTKMWDDAVEKGYFNPKNYDPIRSLVGGQIRTPEFTPEEVSELREKAIIECNFINNANLRKYNVDMAINDFKDVLKNYPDFDFAHVALGEAYLRKGDTRMALECWKKAIAINATNKMALMLLNKHAGN